MPKYETVTNESPNTHIFTNKPSVVDPDPAPPAPFVFGPPGSGSINTRYGSESRSFYQQAKIVRKALDSHCFVSSFELFIFEK
jgi:hypothetical protein